MAWMMMIAVAVVGFAWVMTRRARKASRKSA